MAITELDTPGTAAARQLREEVTRGLQAPMSEVVHTLQRLAIAQVGPESAALDPQLLVRARALAHGLTQVIDELVNFGTTVGTLDSREPQETIAVRTAVEQAAVAAHASLANRSVVVRGAHRVAITTVTHRFQSLLVAILEIATGSGDLRILLERSRGELLLQFERTEVSSAQLDSIRVLARAIGGTADRANAAGGASLVVWLPQQRSSDALEA